MSHHGVDLLDGEAEVGGLEPGGLVAREELVEVHALVEVVTWGRKMTFYGLFLLIYSMRMRNLSQGTYL